MLIDDIEGGKKTCMLWILICSATSLSVEWSEERKREKVEEQKFDSIPRNTRALVKWATLIGPSDGAVRRLNMCHSKPITDSHSDGSAHGCIHGLKGCNTHAR